MNRVDLTYRLRKLGMRKPQFAVKLGMAVDTVYQWQEVPVYAVSLLEALEAIAPMFDNDSPLLTVYATEIDRARVALAQAKEKA